MLEKIENNEILTLSDAKEKYNDKWIGYLELDQNLDNPDDIKIRVLYVAPSPNGHFVIPKETQEGQLINFAFCVESDAYNRLWDAELKKLNGKPIKECGFEREFRVSQAKPIVYNGTELTLIDRIPVKKIFSGTVKLISTKSEYKQAVRLGVRNKPRSNKMKFGSGDEKASVLVIWEDYLEDGICTFEGTSKELELAVSNVWQAFTWSNNMPFTASGTMGAAMIVEINGNTRRYRCNDGFPDEDFDDIIFEITINE